MLMLINPFDVLFSNRRVFRAEAHALRSDYEYYILDTDDLVVEKWGYSELQSAVCKYGLSIENLFSDSSGLLIVRGKGWTLSELCCDCSALNGAVKYTDFDVMVFNGRRRCIKVSHTDLYENNMFVYTNLSIDEDEVYSWDSGVTSLNVVQILYFFLLGNYIIVRIRLMSDTTWIGQCNSVVFALVFNMVGDLIGIVPDKGMAEPEIKCRDAAFMAKFVTYIGMRY